MLDLTIWTDISSHQNAYQPHIGQQGESIKWNKMVDQGVVGVCIRKSLGKLHDAWFEDNWQKAGDAGLLRTVYCVPFVSYDMDPQQVVMMGWPSGGIFDDQVDIPAWDDVERRHKLGRRTAMTRLLPYHYAMKDIFGAAEFYTAKYIWQDYYSLKRGWQKDWGLVAASYRPDLYHLSVSDLQKLVESEQIWPAVPIGWLKDTDGNVIPNNLRWEQWQISADQNNLGTAYGVKSDSIDISFRQGRLPPKPPPVGSAIPNLVVELRSAWGSVGDVITEIEEEVNAE